MENNNFLVLQTDFGLADGAVSAMHGVAHMVAGNKVQVSDLTHEIPAYDIWNASYRLYQTLQYWPEGTTFVSVVDPGVGSARRSIAAKTKTGQFVITPDNGTLTHLAKYVGVSEVREIDESVSRLPHSQESNTFHGRDIYAYNGARLAADQIKFSDLGKSVPVDSIIKLTITPAQVNENGVTGNIDVLDVRFGSLWTNIPLDLLKQLKIERGNKLEVTIIFKDQVKYKEVLPFVTSFADVGLNKPLIYINSLVNVGIALNQASFAQAFNIGTGNEWKVTLKKVEE